MGKIARIVSLEFNSQKDKQRVLAEYRTRLSDLAPNLELLIAINTSEAEVLTIQVFPDIEALEKSAVIGREFFDQVASTVIRDRITYEGDVDFWFQQIKYFGADAIDVSGAGV